MNPIDALWRAIMWVGCVDPKKPGAVIHRLPQDVRESLSKLTSDDSLKMRKDF